ncbi:rRNA cytosine-C5-methylase [Siccirubricoccus deserti]|uniref:RsmB/NOP family class I SAM-dependent RNA methyltransferase n=1 Tax=Siccirubricoccus deserti TaxID=2013562 RepID=A0A9X0R1K5_9PROT|nr:RsmB/NOP family class I SAM-dependent RNA methyltransferase [Siccirubricoccus deserti]MBC4017640.1 RsmB/NOP family class I SAM-dependent RNA methyltransferase [Siccirubricoccus deserti]GGC55277.1 rRNA cytosine-C5-methylase [Siccirubricoccus deserti]
MTPAARLAAAIDLLAALEAESRRPADAIANDFFRSRRYIGGGDRRAISERAWGVVRQRLRLDWWLGRVGARPTPRLLVAAQLLLGEGLKVAEVLATFPGGQYAAPPLNPPEEKLLRALDARRPGSPGLVHPGMPENIRLDLPEWVMPGFRARFGDRLAEEATAMEVEAPLDLRANLLKATREAAAAALAAEGIETEPTRYSPWGLRLPSRRPVTQTRAFTAGMVEVQDEGSQLIALLADARPGMRVLDYCAGAAGKTLALAASMANRGRITACDVSVPRLEGAVRRLRRAGVDNAERHLLVAGDRWAKRRAGQFDRVLVDAPCTGTGTWRRNPDARLRTGPADLTELCVKQGEILSTAAELVRPGGRLIYATCSLLPEEDEAQVNGFLERHPDYALLPLAAAWDEARGRFPELGPVPVVGDLLVTTPVQHGTDGFFAAVLQRRS